MNRIRFANIENNTIIINTCNSDNSNIATTKTQNRKIMTTITNRIFKPMIKKRIGTNYTFFNVITFRNINSFAETNSMYSNDYKTNFSNRKTNLH